MPWGSATRHTTAAPIIANPATLSASPIVPTSLAGRILSSLRSVSYSIVIRVIPKPASTAAAMSMLTRPPR
jgi:hypothetical protein